MWLSLSVCLSWVKTFCLGIQLFHWDQPASTVLMKLLWLLFNSFSCKSGNVLQYVIIIQWARISDFRNLKSAVIFPALFATLNYRDLSEGCFWKCDLYALFTFFRFEVCWYIVYICNLNLWWMWFNICFFMSTEHVKVLIQISKVALQYSENWILWCIIE